MDCCMASWVTSLILSLILFLATEVDGQRNIGYQRLRHTKAENKVNLGLGYDNNSSLSVLPSALLLQGQFGQKQDEIPSDLYQVSRWGRNHGRTRFSQVYHLSTHVSNYQDETPLPTHVNFQTALPIDSLHICDHSPNTFSREFLGHPNDSCEEGKYGLHKFNTKNIKLLCDMIHSSLFPNDSETYYDISVLGTNNFLRMYFVDTYRAICLPLYRLFYGCEEKEYMTICWNAGVIFANPYTCRYSINFGKYYSPYFFQSIISNSYERLRMLCDGTCRYEEREVEGAKVRLSSADHVIDGDSCYPGHLIQFEDEGNKSWYGFTNTHWPSCYAYYKVLWLDNPVNRGLHPKWSFLTQSCKSVEILLIVLVGCVGVVGLAGNLLVVVVMLTGEHRSQESSILRTSLAVADLLTTVFVVFPSFYYHLYPFLFPDLPFEYRIESMTDINAARTTAYIVQTGLAPLGKWYHVFQGLLFTTSTLVSLLTLALLSFERLVLTTESLLYTHIFSVPKVIIFVTFTWIDGILGAILFSYGSTGFVGRYHRMAKLMVGISPFKYGTHINLVFFYIHVAFFAMTILSTVTLSIAAMRNFLVEEARVRAEWKSLKMRVAGPRNQENRYILITQLLMTSLFLLALVPRGFFFMWHTVEAKTFLREHFDILEYMSWWLFLGGSAWNPWVYNMRGSQFRADASNTLRRVFALFTYRRTSSEVKQTTLY